MKEMNELTEKEKEQLFAEVPEIEELIKETEKSKKHAEALDGLEETCLQELKDRGTIQKKHKTSRKIVRYMIYRGYIAQLKTALYYKDQLKEFDKTYKKYVISSTLVAMLFVLLVVGAILVFF